MPIKGSVEAIIEVAKKELGTIEGLKDKETKFFPIATKLVFGKIKGLCIKDLRKQMCLNLKRNCCPMTKLKMTPNLNILF